MLYVLLSILLFHTTAGKECTDKKVSFVTDVSEETVNRTFEVNLKDLNWHATILEQRAGRLVFLCSGSLVQRRLVLTAAGCVARARLSRLRVVVGLTMLHQPIPHEQNLTSVYNVSEKYYPYQDDYTVKEGDLAILKLVNISRRGCPHLVVLPPTARLSKHCFAIGWGQEHVVHKGNQMVEKCPRQGYKNTLLVSIYESKYSQMTLKHFLDFQNILGITKSTVILGVTTMLNMFQNSNKLEFLNVPNELTCPMDEYSQLRTVRVSASGKLRNASLCANTSAICLHTRDTATDLLHKVDIGSPIFCKVKKPKTEQNTAQQNSSSSQYVLAGVVTSKQVQAFPLVKHNTTVSLITATNITHYSNFIFAVMQRKN